MKFLLFLFLFVFIGNIRCSNYLKSYDIIYPTQITQKELIYLMNTLDNNNYMIIDIRPIEFYQTNHIKGAFSIPYNSIARITNVTDINKKKIILYDQKNISDLIIKKIIKKYQIPHVNTLQHGFQLWNGKTKSTLVLPQDSL